MTNWSTCPVVESHPDVASGAWVFRGTCVLIRALFENLRDGAPLDEFLAWFPRVRREQATAVLDREVRQLGAAAGS